MQLYLGIVYTGWKKIGISKFHFISLNCKNPSQQL